VAKAPDPKQLRLDQQAAEAKARADAYNAYETKVHLGDRVYAFRGGAVTARHVAMFRKATRVDEVDPVYMLILRCATFTESAPLDWVAQLVYLARLQEGDSPDIDEILDSVTADTVVRFEYPGSLPDVGEGPVHLDPPA